MSKPVDLHTVRTDFLPFNQPDITHAEIDEVVDTLHSGWLTTGPKTNVFERQFADYVGAPHAVAVNSCTAGLHIALAAYGIGPGDEVIVPTMTFAATANVVLHQHATPVFVDVLPGTLNINPEAVETAVTPHTKAIIPVHLYGHPCQMDALQAIAHKHNLLLIEDAAHAIGASWHEQPVGSIGDMTAFSFYATKNLVTGEGGMVTTHSGELAQKMRQWLLHGISRDAWKRYSAEGSWFYEVVLPGFKYNMMDIQAAMGIHQLARLPQMQARRHALADRYTFGLSDLTAVKLPEVADEIVHAWHIFPIRLKLDQLQIDRAAFIQKLREYNIGTSVHFIPLHRHPYFQKKFNLHAAQFPLADAAYERLISLPLYSRMTDKDVDDVVMAVRRVVLENGR